MEEIIQHPPYYSHILKSGWSHTGVKRSYKTTQPSLLTADEQTSRKWAFHILKVSVPAEKKLRALLLSILVFLAFPHTTIENMFLQ